MSNVDKAELRASPESIETGELALLRICEYIERHKRLGSDTTHAEQLRSALESALAEGRGNEHSAK